MIIDDLRMVAEKGDNGTREIVNKYKAEMVYYLVIKEVIEKYCLPGANHITEIHPDVLGCARDQMAMMASDQGLVRYIPESNGRIRTLTPTMIDDLISGSFHNSEALRKVISSSIASSPDFRNVKMSDEELYEKTSEIVAMESDINNPNSLAYKVKGFAESFDKTAGGLEAMQSGIRRLCNNFDDVRGSKSRLLDNIRTLVRTSRLDNYSEIMTEITNLINSDQALTIRNNTLLQGQIDKILEDNYTVDDTYTMFAGDDVFVDSPEVSQQYGGVAIGSKVRDASGARHIMLKISPLLPELRIADRYYGIFDGINEYNEDGSVVKNTLMQYDAQKGIVSRVKPYGEYAAITHGEEFSTANSIIIKPTEYLHGLSYEFEQSYAISRDDYDTSAGYDIELRRETKNVEDLSDIAKDLNNIFKWQLSEILETYSSQMLTESDIANISNMFDNALSGTNTMFGDIEDDSFDTVIQNANNYFRYIEHMCSTVSEKMSSHEFEIHIDNQSGQYGDGGPLYCMYFTGEATDNMRTAGSNQSRFFATYIYADYTPSRLDISPQLGDIASGGYDTYIVGSGAAHGEASAEGQILSVMDRKRISNDQIAMMRRVFDSYIGNTASARIDDDVVVRKISKRIGSTGISDITEFISDTGSIDFATIKQLLIDDRDKIKEEERANFSRETNADRFRNIIANVGMTLGLDDDEAGNIDRICEKIRSNIIKENEDGSNVDNINEKIRNELIYNSMKAMTDSLRNSFEDDSNNYIVANQIYSKYMMSYINSVMDHVDTLDVDGESLMTSITEQIADSNNPVLIETLDELFGKDDVYVDADGESHVTMLVKPDMCKRCSKRIMSADYDNLYKLLSYDSSLAYVSDMTKTNDTVLEENRTNETHMAVQIYLPILYNEFNREYKKIMAARDKERENAVVENTSNDVSEGEKTEDAKIIDNEALDDDSVDGSDMENTEDEDEAGDSALAGYNSAYEDKIWYDSNFAKLGGESDISYQFISTTQYEREDAEKRALFRAKHPLQNAAMEAVHRKLSVIEDNYSSDRLKITKEGVVYYQDADGDIRFKIGPVIDEAAYVKPIIEDDPDGEYADSIEIERIKRTPSGRVVHSPENNGLADTERVRVHIRNEIELDSRGNLVNPVVFGGLDTSSYSGSSMRIPYRFYGMSGKIAAYDGYDHSDKDFASRISISTYQSGVLANIDKVLALYEIAEHRNVGNNKKKALGIVYTNVGGTTLQKCYRTNTYIIENKAKCDVADRYLQHVQDDDFSKVIGTDDETVKTAYRYVASMVLAQASIYRDRVVMPKIKLDQNIGLYNTVLNLQQCTDFNLRIDRANMRRTDSKSRRVAMFTENRLFDSTLSGTAKQLGGVAFLTDNIVVDRMTGAIMSSATDVPDAHARCSQISMGVIDPSTDGIIMRYNNYPGAQAVDRQQLSNNAIEKAVMIAPNIKFAMINLGSNMEDGYVIAKRAAHKFGHFNEEGEFVAAVVGDKIGDTESGNKGVIARIVNTDLETEDEFTIDTTKNYLAYFMINHKNLRDTRLSSEMEAVLDDIASRYIVGKTIIGLDGDSFESVYKALTSANSQIEGVDLDDFYLAVGNELISQKVEPFYGRYSLDHKQWQTFMDNPELDVAITNVCVLTRSNPSLLEYISDTRKNSPEDSKIILRDANGEPYEMEGACGRYNIYVDCHTAEDKNKDYTETSKRDGRRYGAQEFYALTAKHCSDRFIRYITGRDETLPDRIMVKLNHKLLMNGFMVDPTSSDFKVKVMTEALDGAELKPIEKDGEVSNEGIYTLDELPGHSVVDIDKVAEHIVNLINQNASKKEIDLAIDKMADGQFGVLFNAMFSANNGDNAAYKSDDIADANVSANDKLRHMFVTQFGRYGGNFAVLPDCLSTAEVAVYHIRKEKYEEGDNIQRAQDDYGYDDYDDFYDFDDYGLSYTTVTNVPDGDCMTLTPGVMLNGSEKRIAPLFVTARETLNGDSEVVSSHIDDALQFNIYKTLLAGAVIDKLHKSEQVDDANYQKVVGKLSSTLTSQYRSIKTKKSLDVEHMNQWLKKNVYATVFKRSMTSVWFGNFNVAPDEVGLSIEKAKHLGILKMKEGAENIPDDYEHLWQKYEPIKDDTYVLINRSPGQTTGCIRALRPVIMSEDTGCIQVNPAFATIQDGDFDGDTIGVIGVLADAPKDVIREVENTLTMQANLINTADYRDYKVPLTAEEKAAGVEPKVISFVNPLFIAGNADVAIAKYNMMQKDENGNPVCGYDVDAKLDEITIFANIVEQIKQLDYDHHSNLNGQSDLSGLMAKRLDKINELYSYYDNATDSEAYKMITKCIAENFEIDGDTLKFKKGRANVSQYEEYNKNRMINVYRDMNAYVAAPSLYTHGKSDFEMLENIINDANISKKGKAPQLNALLVFSGIHKNCSEDGKTGLAVVKNEIDGHPNKGNFEIRYMTPEHPEGQLITPELRQELSEKIHIDFRTAQSDVPQSPHRSQIESHSAAQADKSDATGLGGSTAQKMQKIFGAMGYAELGLRISGPITQMFLDAKQNVTVCEKNLMTGKFLLNKICNFERIDQFTDAEFSKSTPSQVRNGQFTFSKLNRPDGEKRQNIYLTPSEATEQLNNFLKMMDLPELSPIDREITMKCLQVYAEVNPKTEKEEVKRLIKTCDKQGDRTYAAMYGNDDGYVELLYDMAANGEGIYSGSIAYEGHVSMDKVNKAMTTKSNKIAKDHIYEDATSVISLTEVITSTIHKELDRQKGFDAITVVPEPVKQTESSGSSRRRRGRGDSQNSTEARFNRLLNALDEPDDTNGSGGGPKAPWE